MTEARKGKIARLPRRLRDEVCEGLSNGDTADYICAWLNKRPGVQAMLAKYFKGEPVNEQNISNWRAGGYQDWLADQSRVENIQRLSDFSARIAQAAGTSLSAGACAVAAGRIQNMLEGLADEDLAQLIPALKMLSDSEINRARLKIENTKLDQNERQLQLEESKFERTTCELFLKWYDSEKARRIADSPKAANVRIEELRALMFGQTAA
jgi:hypothetical protein